MGRGGSSLLVEGSVNESVRGKPEPRDSLKSYYQQAQSWDKNQFLVNQEEIKAALPEEHFTRLQQVKDDHLRYGKNKAFGLVLLTSLLMRLQDMPHKYNPQRITTQKGKGASITQVFKQLFSEENSSYALDEMAMKILAVAKHNNGVIRASISDVGAIKRGGTLKQQKSGSFYRLVGEIQEDYFKEDKQLAEKVLLDYLYSVNQEADKGKQIQNNPVYIKEHVLAKGMNHKLFEFGLNSKTNGRRLENLVHLVEELHCQQKGIADIKKSNVSSSDNKFVGDVQYTFSEGGKEKTVCIDPKDKPLLKEDIIEFRDKLASISSPGKVVKGYLVYTGKNQFSDQELGELLRKMPVEADLIPISWKEYLDMRVNELDQEQLREIPNKINKISTTGEIELFKSL